MNEIFFIEHKNTQIEVDLEDDNRIRLSLRDMDLYLTAGEASHIADMLTKLFQWEDTDEEYEDHGFNVEGEEWIDPTRDIEESPYW